MKILFFGDSHLSAIKKGSENMPELPHDLSFIARPQGKGGVKGIGVNKSGEITTSGDDFFSSMPIAQMNINDYDACCIIGIPPFTIRLGQYSAAFLDAYAGDYLSNGSNQFFSLAGQVHRLGQKLIFIHAPFPASQTPYPLRNHAEYLENIRLFNRKHLAAHNSLILPQARETFALPQLQTKKEFLRSDKDCTHMNQYYGQAMLRELMATLQAP